MSELILDVKVVESSEVYELDGVIFSNAVIIQESGDCFKKIKEKSSFFKYGVVVLSELLKSLSCSGYYLIFTSACGVADDGGWEGIYVSRVGDKVFWDLDFDGECYRFEFIFDQYVREIKRIESEVCSLSKRYEIEPSAVFYPEGWSN